MLVERHDLLLRELVHSDEEGSLDHLRLLVARFFVVVVTLEVDVDGKNDGVTSDELFHLKNVKIDDARKTNSALFSKIYLPMRQSDLIPTKQNTDTTLIDWAVSPWKTDLKG